VRLSVACDAVRLNVTFGVFAPPVMVPPVIDQEYVVIPLPVALAVLPVAEQVEDGV